MALAVIQQTHHQSLPSLQNDEERKWGLFDRSAYTRRWDVPWGGKETVGGMALWVAVFLGTAFLLVPALYINLGSKVVLLSMHRWHVQGKTVFSGGRFFHC